MHGKRKFLSEFAVNLCSSNWLMLPSSELSRDATMGDQDQVISDKCHIYVICQHPAAWFDPGSFKYENGHIEGNVCYRVTGVQHAFRFRRPYSLLDGSTAVQLSPYPHREIHSIVPNGEVVRRLPASTLCFGSTGPLENPHIRKFKVLYVGQAFADGKRSALDRLRSHSTLQKILADASYHNPDSEVFLMMFEYEPYRVITQMDGRATEAIKDDRDSARFYSILENPLTEHQQICLAEAGLIRYFSPHYNKIYKENFPSPNHEILRQCFDLDFSGLIVEINTEELLFSLFSDTVAPSTHHMSSFDLFGHTDRLGFFYLSDGDGSSTAVVDAIR